MLRREDRSDLVICGITDHACSDIWYSKGRAKSGVGLRLTRTFHRWLLGRHFRMCSFYCRSAHNATADFLSRASSLELEVWATRLNRARVDPHPTWRSFCLHIQPDWPEWPEPDRLTPPTSSPNFSIVEWHPGSFTLCEAARKIGRSCSWVDPRHTRIARQVDLHGQSEFFS